MRTTPINQQSADGGKKKKWTSASLIAAVSVGALTTEAANILLAQDDPDAEPISDSTQDSESANEQIPVPEQETSQETEAVSEPITETEPTIEPEPEPSPEPVPEPEPAIEPEPEPVPEQTPEPDSVVDVIVEEIDPQDIDMEDILLVDEIGTVYTVDGRELNAVLIHDSNDNQAVMIDVDGDNVYDVIATPEGEIIAQVPGDIDVSDAELLYAQQHGDTGYIEPNSLDVAMNEESPDIQNDISLT